MGAQLNQLYITHCSHATAFQHQRQDEESQRIPCGYSVRAGSFPTEDSQQWFQKLDSFVHYQLFHDFSGGEKEIRALRYRDVPIRFAYYPNQKGTDIIVHSCFRSEDTSWPKPRIKCYFSHFLTRELSGNSQSLATSDVLQLWGTKSWVCEDAEFSNLSLPAVQSLSAFNDLPAICDEVFLTLLNSDRGGDPQNIIPVRWKNMPKEQIREIFFATLHAFMQIDQSKKEAVVLAVEPSIAALLFYGVCRVLPKNGFGSTVGFSTFENLGEQYIKYSPLIATTLHAPETTVFAKHKFATDGVFINTYEEISIPFVLPSRRKIHAESYARMIVDDFLIRGQEGLADLDNILNRLSSAAPSTPHKLEQLFVADTQVKILLNPADNRSSQPIVLTTDKIGRAYVIDSVAKQLDSILRNDVQWKAICAQPHFIETYLKVGLESQHSMNDRSFCQLVDRLPEDSLMKLYYSRECSNEKKLTLIARYVSNNNRFPKEIDPWREAQPGHRDKPLIAGVTELNGCEVAYNLIDQIEVNEITHDQFLLYLRGILAAKQIKDEHQKELLRSLFYKYQGSIDTLNKHLSRSASDSHTMTDMFNLMHSSAKEESLGLAISKMAQTLLPTAKSLRKKISLITMGKEMLDQEDQLTLTDWKKLEQHCTAYSAWSQEKTSLWNKKQLQEKLDSKQEQIIKLICSILHDHPETSDWNNSKKATIIGQITADFGLAESQQFRTKAAIMLSPYRKIVKQYNQQSFMKKIRCKEWKSQKRIELKLNSNLKKQKGQ